jgi:hypothetical protein
VGLVATTIGEATVEALRDLAANLFDDASVRYDYSGRGMYGGTCLGLVCGGVNELVQFVLAVQRTARFLERDGEQDENSEDQRVARDLYGFLNALEDGGTTTLQDDMGTQVVYYWPRVEVTA